MEEENKRETERKQIEGGREGGRGGYYVKERVKYTGSALHFTVSRVWAYSC